MAIENIKTIGKLDHSSYIIRFDVCKIANTYRVNIRKYFIDDQGIETPTKNGVTINVSRLDEAIELLKETKKFTEEYMEQVLKEVEAEIEVDVHIGGE